MEVVGVAVQSRRQATGKVETEILGSIKLRV